MITFKLTKLTEFIQKDFPPEAGEEMKSLSKIWRSLIRKKLKLNYEELYAIGENVYIELNKFKNDVLSY